MIDKPNFYTTLLKLDRHCDELLEAELLEPGGKPMPPVGEIGDVRIALRTDWGNLRFMFLIPWLVGLCIGLWWHVDDFLETWRSQETTHRRFIESSVRKYGASYFDVLTF